MTGLLANVKGMCILLYSIFDNLFTKITSYTSIPQTSIAYAVIEILFRKGLQQAVSVTAALDLPQIADFGV